MNGAYHNRPLEGALLWILIAIGLVIADTFGCLGLQAFVDHVLNIENEIIAPVVSHLAWGAVLLLVARHRDRAGQKTHLQTMRLAWIATAPVVLLISFVINFKYRFTF